MITTQVAIIGAGLAGLSCAIECEKLGLDYIIIDKNKHVGGRQQTSNINGYICDHGFQSYTPIQQLKSCLILNN